MNKIEYGTEFLDQLKDSVHNLHDENKELRKEIERLKELCNKYEEEHKTTFEEWKKDIQANKKAIEYIENEMPCLWEIDDIWEDINGNYQHNYKEYDTQILLNKLKGTDIELDILKALNEGLEDDVPMG